MVDCKTLENNQYVLQARIHELRAAALHLSSNNNNVSESLNQAMKLYKKTKQNLFWNELECLFLLAFFHSEQLPSDPSLILQLNEIIRCINEEYIQKCKENN